MAASSWAAPSAGPQTVALLVLLPCVTAIALIAVVTTVREELTYSCEAVSAGGVVVYVRPAADRDSEPIVEVDVNGDPMTWSSPMCGPTPAYARPDSPAAGHSPHRRGPRPAGRRPGPGRPAHPIALGADLFNLWCYLRVRHPLTPLLREPVHRKAAPNGQSERQPNHTPRRSAPTAKSNDHPRRADPGAAPRRPGPRPCGCRGAGRGYEHDQLHRRRCRYTPRSFRRGAAAINYPPFATRDPRALPPTTCSLHPKGVPSSAIMRASTTRILQGRGHPSPSTHRTRVGSPRGIAPRGSHGTERDNLSSLRSSHRSPANVCTHGQWANRVGSRSRSPRHHLVNRL
jgi:hypothetical protein